MTSILIANTTIFLRDPATFRKFHENPSTVHKKLMKILVYKKFMQNSESSQIYELNFVHAGSNNIASNLYNKIK